MRREVSESRLVRFTRRARGVIFETSPSRAQGRKRVEARAAVRILKALRGAPRKVWASRRGGHRPHRGDGTLLLVCIVFAIGRCIAGAMAGPIAAAIGQQYVALTSLPDARRLV